MNNLQLSWELPVKLQLQSPGDEVLRFSAFDMERNRLFFASSENNIYATHLHYTENEVAWSSSASSVAFEPVDLEPGDYITSFEYLMEKEGLVIGTSYGVILLYIVDEQIKEVVGQVEGGVKCISPSPDGDLLGVITGFGQLLVMTNDWDLLYEMPLDDAPEDIDVNEPAVSSNYLNESSISWRGDGRFFATLSKSQGSLVHRKLKVWERDTGAIHSVSESKNLKGGALDWMSTGAKIAAINDPRDEKCSPLLVFFEKNGLERGSCSISESDVSVEFIKWNCNSELLATLLRGGRHDTLKIWLYSNNHWYVKQEIRCSKEAGAKFMWNPTKPLQLVGWNLHGEVVIYNFTWVTAVMSDSTAFVVDGSKILVTPLSLSLIPPPMYLFSLTFPAAVRHFSFCAKRCKNNLAASLSDGSLCIVELPVVHMWEDFDGREFSVEAVSCDVEFGSFMHLTLLDQHVLVGVPSSSFTKDGLPSYCLQEIHLLYAEDHIVDSVTGSGWHAAMSVQHSLDGMVVGMIPGSNDRASAYIQYDGGKVVEYTPKLEENGTFALVECNDMSFSSTCLWMALAPAEFGPKKVVICGLDDKGRLQVGRRTVCNNCSSFAFYSNAANQMATQLIVATKQDLLFIVDIADVQSEQLDVKYNNFLPIPKKRNSEAGELYIQIWERGSKVVGVLHGDESAVVLQTIRGNLECIYPRKLVLTSITNALNERRFRDALLMVRRHRIDFNVIVDHFGCQAFLQYVADFVKQVNNLNYITEFICSMRNENVMLNMYKDYISLPFQEDSKAFPVENPNIVLSKTSTILSGIRKSLEEQMAESPARELCILTTFTRSDPPALEEALRRIKVTRERELSGADNPAQLLLPSAEESLKHLLWLSSPEAVFEASLGLYDLKLAAMVALNSQKDPKEFLPFLEHLEHMPAAVMRYNIDLKLQRYENALRHIVSAGDAYYEDSLNLMRNYPHLFPLGLQLITSPNKRLEVLEAWGDHLDLSKNFEDAATCYLHCSCLEKALKAYRACGNWSSVFTVAGLMKLGKDEIIQLAHELCEELQALGKPGDAAKIALDYCNDVKLGIELLIRAREWNEALRIAFLHRNEGLISEVESASLECASMLVSEFGEGLEKVEKYTARFLAVRQRRLLLAAKLQSDERSVFEDDETASVASSNFSEMSAYTSRSRSSAASVSSTATKARDLRRQRKKGKIRAGSPGEELALVEHLKGMSLSSGARHEIKSLLNSLVMLGKEDIARKLQFSCRNYQLSQMAAVKLAEDAASTDIIDEQLYSTEHYCQKMSRDEQHSETFSWQSKVLA